MCRLFLLVLLLAGSNALRAQQSDVLIYGATPAGIAAALAAAKDGERVLMVEPSGQIGGMMTNGLSHAEFRTFEALSGTFLDFTRRVQKHYQETDGADSEQAHDCLNGTQGEPSVNLAVFEKLLAVQPGIAVQKHWTLEGVQCSSAGDDEDSEARQMRALEIALFFDETTGEYHSIAARFFIDATYEGDLMAAAGVPYKVGREGKSQYGEPLAPETVDPQIDASRFHLTMTRSEKNRVSPEAPAGYDRTSYLGSPVDIPALLRSRRIEHVFGPDGNVIFRLQWPGSPNGKFDVVLQPESPAWRPLGGENWEWPDGPAGVAIREGATDALEAPPFSRVGMARSRARIFTESLAWEIGLLYFLQHDEATPRQFQDEAKQWGWCKDEFVGNGGLPFQMQVREARRMTGQYLFTQQDTEPAKAESAGGRRAVLHPDAIAIGDFGITCDGNSPNQAGSSSGVIRRQTVPYQIPYGVIVPQGLENLLVPVAASASHIGFCALHYEPVWMALGEAAGHAAHLAHAEKITVQKIAVAKLQARLHAEGAATIYVGDVPPTSPDFAAVQWWGSAGGWHGMGTSTDGSVKLGTNIAGQYFAAFPGHAVELGKTLAVETEKRWLAIAEKIKLRRDVLPAADGKTTRGEWVQAAFRQTVQ